MKVRILFYTVKISLVSFGSLPSGTKLFRITVVLSVYGVMKKSYLLIIVSAFSHFIYFALLVLYTDEKQNVSIYSLQAILIQT